MLGLDRMFPDMTIDKTTMGKISSIDRSPSAQIAMLLRGNSADDVIPALRRLGYSE